MRDLLLRLRALIFRNRVEQELDEELDFHIEMQTRKNLAAGLGPEQARRRARVQFGANAEAVKDYVRDARRIGFLETLLQDVRYALRGFGQRPLFAFTVIGTIAIGLGWNTAIFTVFNAYVLRPQAVRDPYSLYRLSWSNRVRRGLDFTSEQYQDLKTAQLGFSDAYAFQFFQIRMDGRPAIAELVSGDYFQILGVKALIGRTLLPEDTRAPGLEPVVVIGEAAWKTRFGGASDIVGRKVAIHGRPFMVVGVIGEEFSGLGGLPRDFWAPISMSSVLEEANEWKAGLPAWVAITARLKPGVSEQQAQTALLGWMQRQTEKLPSEQRAIGVGIDSEAYWLPLKYFIGPFIPIGVAFLLVLLSACANVGNMMLARAMSRQREIGIRLSLGAARSRLIRQLLTESILLALPAGGAALLVSQTLLTLGLRTLFATLPAEFVDYVHVVPLQPDFRVFFFMVSAAIASALLFGLAPALQVTRLNVMQAARGDFSSEFRPSRLRNALVVAQVTICALLLIASGILLRGAQRAASIDSGLRIRDVIELSIQEKSRARVLAKLAVEPAVELTASTSSVPLDDSFATVTASAAGAPNSMRTAYNYVSPEYFELFGLHVLRGRNFSSIEASGAGVAVLSETAARKFFPGQEAVGQSLSLDYDPRANRLGRLTHNLTVRIVGIVQDSIVSWKRDQPDMLCLYLPTALPAPGNTLVVRVRGDPEVARRRLDAAMEEADPGAVEAIHKLQEVANGVVYGFRAAYWIAAAVGAVALLLTLSGIYGVLSYLVAQRTKEIGIRLAMGASTSSVIGAVLKQCLRLAVIGTAIGALLALGASQLFASVIQIQMIHTFDRVAFVGGTALVLSACVCAAYFPARRAARVDPIATLRYD
jgi:predicted permease